MKAAPSVRRAWVVVLWGLCAGCAASTTINEDTPVAAALLDDCPCDQETKADELELGRRIFEDRNLSAAREV